MALTPSAHASREISPVDVIDLEVSYDTLTADYYRHVEAQRILDGARTGILAYLRSRGVANPRLPPLRASGRYAHDLHVPGQAVASALLRYGTRLDPRALVYATIAGEAASLNDPYTIFFSPEQEQAFYRYLNPASFGGIGVILHLDSEHRAILIDDVIPNGPAEKGGLHPGDFIWTIDGVTTSGLSADDIQKRLRGKTGTRVMLAYSHGAAGSRLSVQLVRSDVTPPDAIGSMLPGGIGYIRLLSYGEHAERDVAAQLRHLQQAGAGAFVLDLRGNGGGYREAAIAVTARFVPPGPVVIVQERSGKRTTLFSHNSVARVHPLAVLVDRGTASAAEITAGAIQDTESGVLVGTKTFGKGLVQQMFPLPDGAALKVTVERYYTAHGRDIDKKGIEPDIVVPQPPGSIAGDVAHDPQLARALLALGIPQPTPSP
ncbi:MAG: S41 family peptidase [Candidatus Eremiobacteraeota bacterium]|nr:S41 family peptidase [Candidatus Eremiobacteraeota bacterium]